MWANLFDDLTLNRTEMHTCNEITQTKGNISWSFVPEEKIRMQLTSECVGFVSTESIAN